MFLSYVFLCVEKVKDVYEVNDSIEQFFLVWVFIFVFICVKVSLLIYQLCGYDYLMCINGNKQLLFKV